MKKYIQTDELQELIDWENIMKMERCAGGHDEQMKGLFKDSEVIGHWNENDYQGMVATCVKLNDNRFVIYNDYYGSCSGCDAWEDANDEDVKKLCINLSNSAYVFNNLEDVKEFLSNKDNKNKEGNYDWFDGYSNCAENLLKQLK
jgi:hypothetical protein